jgi:branched-chain amino acid transport system permease protein
LGIYIVIVQVIVLIWGNEAQVLHEGPHRVIKVLNCSFTLGQVLTATVAVVFLSIGYVWLRFSNLGLQFRALADSPVEFALRGHNVQIIRIVAFALSGVFGTAAALLTAYDMGFNPHEGLSILLLAIVAVLIGGRGSFLGPVLGGILVGILRAGTIWFLSARNDYIESKSSYGIYAEVDQHVIYVVHASTSILYFLASSPWLLPATFIRTRYRQN